MLPHLTENLRLARIRFTNAIKQRQPLAGFVVIDLSGTIVEFAPAPSRLSRLPFANKLPINLPDPSQSVSGLRRLFEQLAFDPRVKGVLLRVRCVAAPSVYQSLRSIFEKFRSTGKRLIAYGTGFGPFQYYLACSCEQIIMPPPAEWMVLGLAQDHIFLKDALDRVGIEAEVLHVSPFKSAGDQLVRNDFSEESRTQAEWLLDANWQELLNGISQGRRMAPARARELIDSGPHSAQRACELGLIDAVLYEDELDRWLVPASHPPPKPNILQRIVAKIRRKPAPPAPVDGMADREPNLIMLDEARTALMIQPIKYARKRIGIIPIEGMIIDGSSQSSPLPLPLVGGRMAGDETIAQLVRKAERDDTLAAIVLYVNSPGGSALSSDLMAREIARLDQKKPVIVYMGGVAASGGYYVSAPVRHIVAQPLTITGSIGVVMTKPSAARSLDLLKLHHRTLKRGERADAITVLRKYSDEERAAFTESMLRVYNMFKRIVADGRELPLADLEPICGGRVWTGQMAQQRGLVDELGDLSVALRKARELADLADEPRVPAVLVQADRKHTLLPHLWQSAAALLAHPDQAQRWLAKPRVWALGRAMIDVITD